MAIESNILYINFEDLSAVRLLEFLASGQWSPPQSSILLLVLRRVFRMLMSEKDSCPAICITIHTPAHALPQCIHELCTQTKRCALFTLSRERLNTSLPTHIVASARHTYNADLSGPFSSASWQHWANCNKHKHGAGHDETQISRQVIVHLLLERVRPEQGVGGFKSQAAWSRGCGASDTSVHS